MRVVPVHAGAMRLSETNSCRRHAHAQFYEFFRNPRSSCLRQSSSGDGRDARLRVAVCFLAIRHCADGRNSIRQVLFI